MITTDGLFSLFRFRISDNVLALANPKGLSEAQRNGSADLALQGCHVIKLLCQTHLRDRGACDDALNAVLYVVPANFE